MIAKSVDATNHQKISELGQRILGGDHITREEATWLFNLETSADILDLLSWANRIREQFKGNKIHLCSIVNAKAGACSENCSFCAQSSHYQTGSPKYGFIEPEPVNEAADEANKNQVRTKSPPSASSLRGKVSMKARCLTKSATASAN
jgi:biotin synthase